MTRAEPHVPQVKAKAAVVAEVFDWGFRDASVDPG
jgi:hypothetical protein